MIQLPRWKREQTIRKRQRFSKVINIFTISILIVSVCVISFLFFFAFRLSDFKAFDKFNFILMGKELSIVSISPYEERVLLITIPSETLISIPDLSTRYRLGALPKLDSLEKKKGKLILGSIRNFLGLPIEKWLLIEDSGVSFKSTNDVKRFFSFNGILKNLNKSINSFDLGNLTFLDRFQIVNFIWGLRNDKINILSLTETPFLNEVEFADGSKAFEIDSSSLDQLLEQSFSEKNITGEHYTIEIKNGTGISGQAASVKRLLSNIGMNVIDVTKVNHLVIETNICVRSSEMLRSYSIRRLENLLLSKISLCKEEDTRADIVVNLGKDYFFRWN